MTKGLQALPVVTSWFISLAVCWQACSSYSVAVAWHIVVSVFPSEQCQCLCGVVYLSLVSFAALSSFTQQPLYPFPQIINRWFESRDYKHTDPYQILLFLLANSNHSQFNCLRKSCRVLKNKKIFLSFI